MLVEGKVGLITASLPWSNLASGIIALKVQGLQLTLRPVKTRRKCKLQVAKDKGDGTNKDVIMQHVTKKMMIRQSCHLLFILPTTF